MPTTLGPSKTELDSIVNQALDTQSRINIFTTDNGTPHSVSETLLANASPKFAKACGKDKDSLTLDVGLGAFRILLGWLLSATVAETSQSSLVQAWILASQYGIPVLQNAITRAFVKVWEGAPISFEVVTRTYAYGPAGMLRQACVAHLAMIFTQAHKNDWRDILRTEKLDTNAALLIDLVSEMQKAIVGGGKRMPPGAAAVLKQLMVDEIPAPSTATKRTAVQDGGSNKRGATMYYPDDRLNNV
nr:hypothetical protein B0A51_08478 [Rachicladosporium sp. CCFEE 5018]